MVLVRTHSLKGFVSCIALLSLAAGIVSGEGESRRQPQKAFLDAAAIMAAWDANYGRMKTFRITASETMLDPPENSNYVQYYHIERLQDGVRYHIRTSTAKERFDPREELLEWAYDGRVTTNYTRSENSAEIRPGLTGRDVETKDMISLYTLSDPAEFTHNTPRLRLLYDLLGSSARVRETIEIVQGEPCHVLEMNDPDGATSITVSLAHEKGMLPLKYRQRHKDGFRVEMDITDIGEVTVDEGHFWYPARAQRLLHTREGETLRHELAIKAFDPDPPLADEMFRVDPPPGTKVFDWLTEQSYVVEHPGAEDGGVALGRLESEMGADPTTRGVLRPLDDFNSGEPADRVGVPVAEATPPVEAMERGGASGLILALVGLGLLITLAVIGTFILKRAKEGCGR